MFKMEAFCSTMMTKMTQNQGLGGRVVKDRVVVAKEADNISVAVEDDVEKRR
jgi:hypothetical protein